MIGSVLVMELFYNIFEKSYVASLMEKYKYNWYRGGLFIVFSMWESINISFTLFTLYSNCILMSLIGKNLWFYWKFPMEISIKQKTYVQIYFTSNNPYNISFLWYWLGKCECKSNITSSVPKLHNNFFLKTSIFLVIYPVLEDSPSSWRK